MNYAELPVPAHLARWVAVLWSLSGPAAAGPPEPDRLAADGHVEMVFHFADPFRRRDTAGTEVTQFRAAVVGAFTDPMELLPTGRVGVFGVRLRRGGAEAVLRENIARLTGESVPFADLWGRGGAEIEERVCDAGDDAGRAALVLRALERRLLDGRVPRAPDDAERVLRLLERSGGRRSVAELADEARLSARTLQRRFLERTGLPPRTMARIVRFQEALRRLDDGPRIGWAALAHDLGFADQAHLVREFRRFTGSPPARYAATAHPLAESFQGRDTAAGRRPAGAPRD